MSASSSPGLLLLKRVQQGTDQQVYRTSSFANRFIGYVSITGSGLQRAMPKQHLNGSYVRARFQKMRRETVPQRANRHALVQT
jgi:hypothetical protein